jgi:RHS repeat-associated protein
MLLSQVAGGRMTQYEYDDANRLTSVDSQEYAWDENGNLVWDGVFSYTYDAANRLVEVTNGITAVEYVYNGDGQRAAQVVGGVETRYTLDVAAGLEQVLVEETGGVATAYLYGLGRVAAQEDGGARRYYLHDGLGNVRAEMSAAGVLLAVRSFSPFGEPIQGGDGGAPWGYTGEQWDDVASLLYLRARYYSPVLGRFVSKDLWRGNIRRPGALNRYQYVLNNPVNFVDPTGYVCEGLSGIAFEACKYSYLGAAWLAHRANKDRDIIFFSKAPPRERIQACVEVGVFATLMGLVVYVSGKAVVYVGGEAVAYAIPSSTRNIEALVRQAQQQYPKLAGMIHEHHIYPKYLGGDPKGPVVYIDAAYHQLITNAIRARFPYGQGPYDPAQVAKGLEEVYRMYPLP